MSSKLNRSYLYSFRSDIFKWIRQKFSLKGVKNSKTKCFVTNFSEDFHFNFKDRYLLPHYFLSNLKKLVGESLSALEEFAISCPFTISCFLLESSNYMPFCILSWEEQC